MATLRSHTHPPVVERLAAVQRGWGKVGRINPAPAVNPFPTNLFELELKIDVYGQVNTIYILPASSSMAHVGRFAINFQNETKTFYLGDGKVAEVNLYGQVNKVYISPKISDRVRVSQSGQNNEVIIR
jgi:hypothetical protein